MNIIVKPFGQEEYYCRPDTTWERENKDFYVPEGINEIAWSPILFARICKAGKHIGSKFASRYYDALNYGGLLYCHREYPSDGFAIAGSSCVDHSSILPYPLFNPIVIGNDKNVYKVFMNDETLFELASGEKLKECIEEAICKASKYISLRIGDHIAIELKEMETIAAIDEPKVRIRGEFCENQIFETKLIF